MLLNSFSFLAFFTLVVVVYYAIAHRYRWLLLLVASLYFYAALNSGYVVLLLGITLVAYLAGLALGSSPGTARKAILAIGVTVPLAALVVFKVPGTGLAAVAGLSFYTFSCVSYVADVYAGRLPAERHAGRLALYVAFFPKLLAGPIERARPFLSQLAQPVAFSGERVSLGLQQMLWGLFKKVVIADRLAPFVNTAYGLPAFAPPGDLVIATYFFAFQLYCDFSGYSDIAIGAAKVLGFDLVENFRRPFFSTSVGEFWTRRWHVSLSAWFRDYMYIPLGGSRRPLPRVYLNVLAVFVVSGLWHGANWTFLVWGALNGLYVIGSLLTRGIREQVSVWTRVPVALRRVLGGLLTFHLILVTWVFFRASSISDAATILSRIVASAPILPAAIQLRLISADMLLSLGLIAILLAVEALDEGRPFWEQVRMRPLPVRWAVYYGLLFALIVLGSWDRQQFVYMQF